jgi:hypothetical protein
LLLSGVIDLLILALIQESLVATDGGLGDYFKDATGSDFHKPRVVGLGGSGIRRNLDGSSGVYRLWSSGGERSVGEQGVDRGKEENGRLRTSKEHPRNMLATTVLPG